MANDQMTKESQLIIMMLQDLKKDFKDHTDNVFERLNSLQCAAQEVRIRNIMDRISTLEGAPAKKNASIVAWCSLLFSGFLGLFEFLKWRNV